MKHYSKEKELREKFWQEIFGSIDEACSDLGWDKEAIRDLFKVIRNLTEKKNEKKPKKNIEDKS